MLYDLSNELDRERLKARIAKDLEKRTAIDYSEHKFKTSQQNRYLHLLIGVVAMEYGTSIEYAKAEYFKRLVNHEIFAYTEADKVLGREVEKLKSITKIPIEELSKAIDKFKLWGRENGMRMPEANEKELLRLLEIELGRQRWI